MLTNLRGMEGTVGGAGVGLVPMEGVEMGVDEWIQLNVEVSFSTSQGRRTLAYAIVEWRTWRVQRVQGEVILVLCVF